MWRLLWSGAGGRNLTQVFYTLWTRTSAVVVVGWAALSANGSWFVTIGLSALLILLLIGGIALLALGVRDLVRDMRHHLHARSEKE